MAIDLKGLLERAFFTEDVQNASESIERGVEKYEAERRAGARVFEVAAPAQPDEDWVREHLVRELVYYCESEGQPVPGCGSTVVALFIGPRLHMIAASEVVRWATEQFGLSPDELRARYGTQESDTAQR